MNQLLILLFLTISFANAQSKIITGVVSDGAGMPIPGVQVVIENTREVVQTDLDGKYSIKGEPEQKLTFSFPGMIFQSVTVGNSIIIDIVLVEEEAIVISDKYRTTTTPSFKDPGYLVTGAPNASVTKQLKNSTTNIITTYELNRYEIDSIYNSYCNGEFIRKVIQGDIGTNHKILNPENILYYISVMNCDSTSIEIKKKLFTEKIIEELNLRKIDFKEEQYPFRCGTSHIRSEINAIPPYDKQMAIENFLNSHKNINSSCLYLIDWKPIRVSSDRQFMRLLKKFKKLKFVNITALSGDGATAIYGSCGRNGLYVITTESKNSKR